MLEELILQNLSNYYLEYSDKKIQQFFLPGYYINKLKQTTGYFTKKHKDYLFNILKNKISSSKLSLDTENYYIAGGAVLSLILYGNPFAINDVDIFPKTEEDFNSIKSKILAIDPTPNIKYETDNAICFELENIKIDLIKKFYPTLIDCLEAFDLSCCKVGYTNEGRFYTRIGFHDIFDLKMKISHKNLYDKEHNVQTLKRILKYSKKGFTLSRDNLIDLITSLKLDSNDFNSAEFKEKRKKVIEEICPNYKISESKE